MALHINGCNFSYDYSELLAELADDIKEEQFKMDDEIVIEREPREDFVEKGIDYIPIVDYYFKSDNPPEGKYFEKVKISDLIIEMEKLNSIM